MLCAAALVFAVHGCDLLCVTIIALLCVAATNLTTDPHRRVSPRARRQNRFGVDGVFQLELMCVILMCPRRGLVCSRVVWFDLIRCDACFMYAVWCGLV